MLERMRAIEVEHAGARFGPAATSCTRRQYVLVTSRFDVRHRPMATDHAICDHSHPGLLAFQSMVSDLRLACRALTRHRALSAAAVLTLAVGIGSTTPIFSAADAVLLRPLPFRDQDRLVVMWETDLRRDAKLIELSHRDFSDWRAQSTRFEAMAAMTAADIRVTLRAARDPSRSKPRSSRTTSSGCSARRRASAATSARKTIARARRPSSSSRSRCGGVSSEPMNRWPGDPSCSMAVRRPSSA